MRDFTNTLQLANFHLSTIKLHKITFHKQPFAKQPFAKNYIKYLSPLQLHLFMYFVDSSKIVNAT